MKKKSKENSPVNTFKLVLIFVGVIFIFYLIFGYRPYSKELTAVEKIVCQTASDTVPSECDNVADFGLTKEKCCNSVGVCCT